MRLVPVWCTDGVEFHFENSNCTEHHPSARTSVTAVLSCGRARFIKRLRAFNGPRIADAESQMPRTETCRNERLHPSERRRRPGTGLQVRPSQPSRRQR